MWIPPRSARIVWLGYRRLFPLPERLFHFQNGQTPLKHKLLVATEGLYVYHCAGQLVTCLNVSLQGAISAAYKALLQTKRRLPTSGKVQRMTKLAQTSANTKRNEYDELEGWWNKLLQIKIQMNMMNRTGGEIRQQCCTLRCSIQFFVRWNNE